MKTRVFASAGLVGLVAVTALAQGRGFRGFGGGLGGPFTVPPNVRYDGRFTFVRLKYTTAPGGYWYRGLPAWAHGYPVAEQNLMRIMNEVSGLEAHTDDITVLALDDPELFKYPVAYIIEVGWWEMTDREAVALRAYLQKGGFVIVDDFSTGRREFVAELARTPGVRLIEGDVRDITTVEAAVAGCDRVFTDKASGKLARRPELGDGAEDLEEHAPDKALLVLRKDDQLVVTKLDRLGRSLDEHLIELAVTPDPCWPSFR